MLKRKKIISLSALTIAVIIVAVLGIGLFKKGNDAVGNVYSPKAYLCGFAATTSVEYFDAGGASSTCIVYVGDSRNNDLKWITTASSSSSVLQVSVSFAHEMGAEKTWYNEKNFTTTNNNLITYSDGPVIRRLPLTNGGTSTHNMSVNGTNDRWMRVEYTIADAAGGLNLIILPKNESQ